MKNLNNLTTNKLLTNFTLDMVFDVALKELLLE